MMTNEWAAQERGVRGAPISIRHLAIMLGLAAACIGYSTFNRDKAHIFLGKPDWCGIYCVMAKDYTQKLRDQSFDKYYFRKSLESAVAHAVLKPFVPIITPLLANRTLEYISALALLGAAWAWFTVARTLVLSPAAAWIGFTGICLGQTTLKVVPAVQESPDTIALLLGLLSLLAYLKRNQRWLFVSFVAAGFVQSQLQLALLPLVLLPPATAGTSTATGSFWRDGIGSMLLRWLSWITEFIGRDRKTLLLILLAGYAVVFLVCGYVFPYIRHPFHGVDNEISWAMPLSIALATAVMGFALRELGLAAAIRAVPCLVKGIPAWRWGLVAIVYVIQGGLAGYFGRGEEMSQGSSTLGTLWLIYSFHYQAIEQPLKSLAAHIAYFGPLAAVITWRWRCVAGELAKLADARLVLSFAVMTALLVNSESRHLIAYLPWFAVLALVGLPAVGPRPATLYFVAAALASRLYVDYMPVTPDHDPFLMTWGPWYTKELYVLNLVAALGLMFVAVLMSRGAKSRRRSEVAAVERTGALD